jgi:signal transduction histidine kinase
MGIVVDDRDKIFDKFFRGGNEATRKTRGTGLGLFIAQHLTAKQNGSISIRSNHPKGSIFEVVFDEYIS